MAVFEYTAIALDGRRRSGVIDADSARAARKELRLRQLNPLDVNEAREESGAARILRAPQRRIKSGDLVLATRQLSMLIKAGTPVEEAVASIAAEAENEQTRRVLMGVRGQVSEGYSLAEALKRAPRSFPPYYRAVVSAGQLSGRLGDVLERLAVHLEKSQKMRRKMLSALIYPIVLAVVALAVVSLLMIFVVPAVVEQFNTLGQDLPWLTDVVIAVSDFMRGWGLIAIPLAFAAVWGIRRALAQPAMKRSLDRFLLRVPVIGKLVRTVNAATFARTFATLSASGATVPDSLVAARDALRNAVFRDAVETVRRNVEEGQSLARSMKQAGVFPPMLLHMASSGERGGDLAGMMTRSAEYLEDEFDGATTVALGLLEPLLIVFLAAVVALIVLSIMLPILQLNTLAIG